MWLSPDPHAQRGHLVVENYQRGHGDQQLQALTARAEFQLLGAPAARAAEEYGYFSTGSDGNCGRNLRASCCRRRNKQRTATSLIGDAKPVESERQRDAGAAGGETATGQAAADLCS